MYEIIVLGCTAITAFLTIVNTYWAYKRTCYNRDTYKGSKDYWDSWATRSKDVARTVLKEMPTEDLEMELETRFAKARKKRKESR